MSPAVRTLQAVAYAEDFTSSLRLRIGARILCRLAFLEQPLMERYLTSSIFFAPGTRVGEGKLIVAGEIVGGHFHIVFELRDGFSKACRRIQSCAQRQECVLERGINFRCCRKMRDSVVPLGVSPRQLP